MKFLASTTATLPVLGIRGPNPAAAHRPGAKALIFLLFRGGNDRTGPARANSSPLVDVAPPGTGTSSVVRIPRGRPDAALSSSDDEQAATAATVSTTQDRVRRRMMAAHCKA